MRYRTSKAPSSTDLADLFVSNPAGNLRIWHESRPDHEYVIGADCSLGRRRSSDYSCGVVLDRMTKPLLQVAELHGHYEPPAWALALDALRRYYGGPTGLAPTIVEENGYGGWVNSQLATIDDMNLYVERDEKSIDQRLLRRYGFQTNGSTKPRLIGLFMKALRNGELELTSDALIDELLDMVPSGAEGSGRADEGHDDRAMACMLALWMHVHWPMVLAGDPKADKYADLDLLSRAYRERKDTLAEHQRQLATAGIYARLRSTSGIAMRLRSNSRRFRRVK